MERAVEVARHHGEEVRDGDGPALRRQAAKGRYRLKTSSFVRDGNAVFEVVLTYNGAVRLHGRRVEAESGGAPTVEVERFRPGRWQGIFFAIFPIYLDQMR